ncbi:hypothetical protein CGZ94_09950 [Enemella evansiae]|uniref:Uncharacterized protein n=1 Tax=Enemella evansiae TaxID=2016499 RepID=A0A255GG60_9ACTN|nr:hypothetical protein CGZ94_09950 [Enemella evansiae]
MGRWVGWLSLLLRLVGSASGVARPLGLAVGSSLRSPPVAFGEGVRSAAPPPPDPPEPIWATVVPWPPDRALPVSASKPVISNPASRKIAAAAPSRCSILNRGLAGSSSVVATAVAPAGRSAGVLGVPGSPTRSPIGSARVSSAWYAAVGWSAAARGAVGSDPSTRRCAPRSGNVAGSLVPRSGNVVESSTGDVGESAPAGSCAVGVPEAADPPR